MVESMKVIGNKANKMEGEFTTQQLVNKEKGNGPKEKE
jgi:hypothetical protein